MSAQGLVVRPFREDDAAAVVALWRRVFPDDPPWNDPEKVARRKLEVQRELFLVGEREGVIVAAVLGGFDGHRGWVHLLAVAPEERRKGIGRAIMAAAEERLRGMGCDKLNLQVRASNAEVVRFYERLGYSVEDRVSMGKLLE